MAIPKNWPKPPPRPLVLKPHGTYAAWHRHKNAHEKPCEPCQKAYDLYHMRYMKRRRLQELRSTMRATSPASAARQGARNQRAGLRWMRDVLTVVKEYFPHAAIQTKHHVSDLAGTGDVAIEVTLAGWDQIGAKASQAAADAATRRLDHWVIFKARRADIGGPRMSVGQGWAITSIQLYLALQAEVQQLRSDVATYQAALRRGSE